MKKTCFLLLCLLGLVLSCGTGPKPVGTADPSTTVPQEETAKSEAPGTTSQAAPGTASTLEPATEPEEFFDPGSISEEVYAAAKAEIQHLIEDLNGIIRARNYNAWLSNLSDSYLQLISSPDFLADRTEELFRRDQVVAQNLGRDPRMVEKRILRNPRDYFTNVVVPSRSNDRVDDIDFVSANNVKAYTFDQRGQRLVLYNLAIIDGKWKIIN